MTRSGNSPGSSAASAYRARKHHKQKDEVGISAPQIDVPKTVHEKRLDAAKKAGRRSARLEKKAAMNREDPARVATLELRAERKAERRALRFEKKARNLANPAWISARAKAVAINNEHHERQTRIFNRVVGKDRQFSGSVIISSHNTTKYSDNDLMSDISDRGKAVIYWTDASLAHEMKTSASGYMGAGIAWLEYPSKNWLTKEVALGRNTGSIGDGELFAVVDALNLAVQEVVAGTRVIERVRIFTDRVGILHGINKKKLPLGPMISGRLAVQDLFDHSDWLYARGIRVEVVWVKGHAVSEGNKKADRAAFRAVRAQAVHSEEPNETLKTAEDVPSVIKEAGEDFVNEWLFFANRFLLVRRGLAVTTDDSELLLQLEEGEGFDNEMGRDFPADNNNLELHRSESLLQLEEGDGFDNEMERDVLTDNNSSELQRTEPIFHPEEDDEFGNEMGSGSDRIFED